jgi:hypothetical protein
VTQSDGERESDSVRHARLRLEVQRQRIEIP